jgi:hypothetical protein
MRFQIDETFEVRAPVALVRDYLGDPRAATACVPGAELREQRDDRTWGARLTVRVGPASVAYEGALTVEAQEDTDRVARLRADGTEAAGSGSVHAAVTLGAREAGTGCALRVVADLDVVGRVEELGQPIVERVARQLARDFADRVRAVVEPRASGAAGAATTEESLTLSGAFREHPMLRDTLTGMPAASRDASRVAPRVATAVPQKRETPRAGGLPMLLQGVRDRVRAMFGAPPRS